MRGFTLIEGILSIAVIGIGVYGLLNLFPLMMHSSLLADQTVIASNLAQETLESIIAQKDCDETGCGYSATLADINTNSVYDQNPVTGFANYAVDATALEVDPDDDNSTDDFLDASPGSGIARITVQVSWNNAGNSISLYTLIADY